MDNNAHIHDQALKVLEARPGWGALTAFERTKALLEILARQGAELPNWTVIRGLIGKGSSTDINRAKREFRKELGLQLARMHGVKGMPDEIGTVFANAWAKAVEHAGKAFEDQVTAWSSDLERAEAAHMEAESQRDEAFARIQALEGEKAGLQESNRALQALADAERAGKEQAERMFESTRAELAGQLDKLQGALTHSQQETADALTRFEGMERRLLMEVDRARQEVSAQKEIMEAERNKALALHATDMQRMRNQLNEVRQSVTEERTKHAETSRQLTTVQAEAAELRRQLTAAQDTINKALQGKSPDKPQGFYHGKPNTRPGSKPGAKKRS